MYEELIERLKNRRICIQQSGGLDDFPLLREAADSIEQLSNAGSAYGRGWTLGYDAGREENKPRWIPVSEKLPGSGVPTLICGDGNVVEQGVFDDEHGYWYDGHGYRTFVHHWMPLPKWPEEE